MKIFTKLVLFFFFLVCTPTYASFFGDASDDIKESLVIGRNDITWGDLFDNQKVCKPAWNVTKTPQKIEYVQLKCTFSETSINNHIIHKGFFYYYPFGRVIPLAPLNKDRDIDYSRMSKSLSTYYEHLFTSFVSKIEDERYEAYKKFFHNKSIHILFKINKNKSYEVSAITFGYYGKDFIKGDEINKFLTASRNEEWNKIFNDWIKQYGIAGEYGTFHGGFIEAFQRTPQNIVNLSNALINNIEDFFFNMYQTEFAKPFMAYPTIDSQLLHSTVAMVSAMKDTSTNVGNNLNVRVTFYPPSGGFKNYTLLSYKIDLDEDSNPIMEFEIKDENGGESEMDFCPVTLSSLQAERMLFRLQCPVQKGEFVFDTDTLKPIDSK